jgi:hypothetical protein
MKAFLRAGLYGFNDVLWWLVVGGWEKGPHFMCVAI